MLVIIAEEMLKQVMNHRDVESSDDLKNILAEGQIFKEANCEPIYIANIIDDSLVSMLVSSKETMNRNKLH